MALRALIASAFILFATVPSYAQECYTLDRFSEAVKAANASVLVSNAKASKKIIAKVNENRIAAGRQPVDGKLIAISLVPKSKTEIDVIAAIFDPNGCVIQDTVAVMTLPQWVSFADTAGVTADDFFLLQGA